MLMIISNARPGETKRGMIPVLNELIGQQSVGLKKYLCKCIFLLGRHLVLCRGSWYSHLVIHYYLKMHINKLYS